jgi:hypothetical protein
MRPQTNGMNERFNGYIKQVLHCLCTDNPSVWSQLLAPAVFAINTAVNEFTGVTPFLAVYGREAVIPGSFLLAESSDLSSVDPVTDHIATLADKLAHIHSYIHELYARDADKLFKHNAALTGARRFKVGDYAQMSRPPGANTTWRETKKTPAEQEAYNLKAKTLTARSFFSRPFYGPFVILEPVGAQSYLVRPANFPQARPTIVHGSRLKYIPTPVVTGSPASLATAAARTANAASATTAAVVMSDADPDADPSADTIMHAADSPTAASHTVDASLAPASSSSPPSPAPAALTASAAAPAMRRPRVIRPRDSPASTGDTPMSTSAAQRATMSASTGAPSTRTLRHARQDRPPYNLERITAPSSVLGHTLGHSQPLRK